jgi:hypothetical protein
MWVALESTTEPRKITNRLGGSGSLVAGRYLRLR